MADSDIYEVEPAYDVPVEFKSDSSVLELNTSSLSTFMLNLARVYLGLAMLCMAIYYMASIARRES